MEGTEKQGAEVDYKVNISNPPQAEQTQPEDTPEVQAEEQVQAEGNEEQVQEQVEQPQAQEQAPQEPQQQETAEEAPAMSREELFNQLLQTKYNIGADELENVLTNSTQAQELPEEVKAYMEYHKETKRGLNDYLRLQQDFSQVPDSQLLREYYKQTKQGLDDNDVNALLDLKFGYDEGAEQSVITSKTIEMKEELFKQNSFLKVRRKNTRSRLSQAPLLFLKNNKEPLSFTINTEKSRRLKKLDRSVHVSLSARRHSLTSMTISKVLNLKSEMISYSSSQKTYRRPRETKVIW